jgi:antitoxin VapB
MIYTMRYISFRIQGTIMSKRAKIFMNGRSQAVRLPKECRFECDEVFVHKSGDKVVLSACEPGWDEFFDGSSAFGDDFLADREDIAAQERNDF